MSNEEAKIEREGESHFAVTYQCLSLSELKRLPEIRAYIRDNFPDRQVIFEECTKDREKDRGRFWLIKPGKKDVKGFSV
jgi:hypothetical protein